MMKTVYAVAENRFSENDFLLSSLDLFFFETLEEAEEICDLANSHPERPECIIYTVIECKTKTVAQVKEQIITLQYFQPPSNEYQYYCPN